ncbi:MAG: hypothetical protein IT305_32795 [Chloroflexi bacterium]|nr:hypothetical protein [Chloroflexota bacterium]
MPPDGYERGVGGTSDVGDETPSFIEPKLTFVLPKLTRQGDLRQITKGFPGPFLGSFDPGSP